jgi:2-polyprenyl-6-methoxyphenol hydroxylase-like FAD-dependent oxidoreductase
VEHRVRSASDKGTEGGVTQPDLRRRLLELHGQWAEPVPQLIESAEAMLNIAIHDVPSLPAWSVGRTILIGDAAHAVAPHSGQGASMALEDAQFLAKLVRASQGVGLDRVFADFERERRPRTDGVIALGRRSAQRKERMSPVAYWIQQQMIRIVVPLTHVRRQDWLLAYKIK